jgi:uncharacterized protein (DUF2384 family)
MKAGMGSPTIQHLEQVEFTAMMPVIAHAGAVFGDQQKAMHWLSTPLEILQCHTPFEVLRMGGGIARIETILTRIEHNIPS